MTHSQGSIKDLQTKADPERWMRWLLSFCQINLRQLSREEWIGLKHDLHALCQSSSPFDFAQMWRGSRIAASPKAQFEFAKGQMTGLRTRTDILTVQKILKEGLTQLYPKQLPTDHDKVFRVWKVPCLGSRSLHDAVFPDGWAANSEEGSFEAKEHEKCIFPSIEFLPEVARSILVGGLRNYRTMRTSIEAVRGVQNPLLEKQTPDILFRSLFSEGEVTQVVQEAWQKNQK